MADDNVLVQLASAVYFRLPANRTPLLRPGSSTETVEI